LSIIQRCNNNPNENPKIPPTQSLKELKI
jgi:hypothetical protein